MSNEAETAPVDQEAGTTDTSTSSEDLGDLIRNSVDNPTVDSSNEVEKLNKMINDLKVTQGRMSGELGALRKEKAEMETEESEPVEDLAEIVYSDPEAFAKKIAKRITAQVEKKIAPVVQPVQNLQTANVVQEGSPLATKLLKDPRTSEYLTNIANDPEALESFEDPKRVRLEAALFRRMNQLYGPQEKDRKNPPPPPRPENAGAPDPETATTGGKETAPPTPTSLDESIKAFTQGMQELGYKR
jgi:hypothetical protein